MWRSPSSAPTISADIHPGALEPLHHLMLGQTGTVSSCTFSDDSKLLATGDLDGKVRMWDLSDLDNASSSGLAEAGQLTDCDIDPEGEIVLTARSSGKVELLEGRGDATISSVGLSDEALAACAYAPAERVIVALTESGVLHRLELDTRAVDKIASCGPEHSDPVRTSGVRDLLSFSLQGDAVAVVGAEPLAVLERIGDEWVKQDLIRSWAAGGHNARTGSTCAAFVGDGSILAIGYDDGRVALVRRDDGEVLASERDLDDSIVACVVDHTRGELVVACRDGMLVRRRADNLTFLEWTSSGHDGDLTGLSITDRYLYTVGVDGTLRLASRATGTGVVTIGLGEPAVAVRCHQPLVVATTHLHVHRFLEI